MANVIEFIVKGTDQFSGTMGKINRSFDGFGSKAVAVGGTVLALTSALTALAIQGINTADEMGKLADKAGTTVEKFSALNFAAGINEVNTQQLSQALRFLSLSMEESARKAGVGGGALGSLGVSATDATGKMRDVVDVLLDVADAFSKSENGAGKVDAAIQLFGRSGLSMIPMLNQGKESLTAMMKKAEEMGLVVTKKTAAMADKFNDNMYILKQSVQAFSLQLAADLLPALTDVSVGMVQFFSKGREGNTVFQAMGTVIKALATAFIAAVDLIERFGKTIGAIMAVVHVFMTEGPKKAAAVWKEHQEEMAADSKKFADAHKTIWEGVPEDVKKVSLAQKQMRVETDAAIKTVQTLREAWMRASGDTAGLLELQYSQQRQQIDATIRDEKKKAEALVYLNRWHLEEMTKDQQSHQEAAFKASGEMSQRLIGMRFDAIEKEAQKIQEATGNAIAAEQYRNAELIRLSNEQLAVRKAANELILQDQILHAQTMGELTQATFALYLNNMKTLNEEVSALMVSTFDTAITGFGNAVGQALVYGKSLSEALRGLLKQVAAQVISTLISIGVKRVLASFLGSKSEVSGGLATVYVNSFASAAAIPFYGWAMASGVASANLATAAAGAAPFLAGAAVGGIAHGGMDYVPSESTYLLDKGERVLSPNQNKDLTGFMEGGGAAPGVTVTELNVNISIPESQALINMDKNAWREIVARNVIPALDVLDRQGTRPEAAQRGRV